MKYTLIAGFLFLNVSLHAQLSVYNRADTTYPVFAGGNEAWLNFLKTKLHPQTPVIHKAPAGTYIVTVSFFIDTTGKVCAVTIVNDPGYGTGNDVLNAFQHCPSWIPGILNNRKIICRQQQDITYWVN